MKSSEYNWSFERLSARLAHPVGRPLTTTLIQRHHKALLELDHRAVNASNLFCISAEKAIGVAASTAFKLGEEKPFYAVKTVVNDIKTNVFKGDRVEKVTTLRQAIESGDSTPLIHGLRAPVSRLVGLVDLLAREQSLSTEAKEYIAFLIKTAARMRRTVDYLLISSADPSYSEALRLTNKSDQNDALVKWLNKHGNAAYCEVLAVLASLGLFMPYQRNAVQQITATDTETLAWELPEYAMHGFDSISLHTKLSSNQLLTNWLLNNADFAVLVATSEHRTFVMVRQCLHECIAEVADDHLGDRLKN